MEKVKGGNATKKRQINVISRTIPGETSIYECMGTVGHALHPWSTMNSCLQIFSRTHFPRVFDAVTQQVYDHDSSFHVKFDFRPGP